METSIGIPQKGKDIPFDLDIMLLDIFSKELMITLFSGIHAYPHS